MSDQTTLLIVCDDKLKENANALMCLIGQNDDIDSEANGSVKIIGTKDGTVKAAIWTEKQYKDSMAEIGSDMHVLFIGDLKETKSVANIVKYKFDKFGMHFGYLGKRAVMYVDNKTLKKADYDQFFEFSKKYQEEFKKVKVNVIKNLPIVVKWVGTLMPYVYPVAIYGLISGSKAHKEIRRQQYRCLTMVVYLDWLNEFLEE